MYTSSHLIVAYLKCAPQIANLHVGCIDAVAVLASDAAVAAAGSITCQHHQRHQRTMTSDPRHTSYDDVNVKTQGGGDRMRRALGFWGIGAAYKSAAGCASRDACHVPVWPPRLLCACSAHVRSGRLSTQSLQAAENRMFRRARLATAWSVTTATTSGEWSTNDPPMSDINSTRAHYIDKFWYNGLYTDTDLILPLLSAECNVQANFIAHVVQERQPIMSKSNLLSIEWINY